MNPLCIIQLTDCHVAADPAADYRGQNADRNLAAVLSAVMGWQPDIILLTGDVSEDGSEESYRRVAAMLVACNVPVLALPGNHDDPSVMRQYFPTGPWDGPQAFTFGDWRLVLLDSTERGRVSGVIDEHSIQWLEAELKPSGHHNHLLALHHQPVEVGSYWIDRYGLESPQSFMQLAEGAPSTRCVVWGHVHHDFRLNRSGIAFLGAPSSVANSLPGTERFTLDPAGPACRWLKLYPDGKVETEVLVAAN